MRSLVLSESARNSRSGLSFAAIIYSLMRILCEHVGVGKREMDPQLTQGCTPVDCEFYVNSGAALETRLFLRITFDDSADDDR